MHIIRYYRHTQTSEQDYDPSSSNWLDLTVFHPIPSTCITFHELRGKYGHYHIPVALLGFTTPAKKPRIFNPFAIKSYSYITVTFHQLFFLFDSLREEDRFLCTMVLPNMPVHFYFDIDGTSSHLLNNDLACAQELVDTFSDFFQSQFHRLPDLSGMHWETASNDKKISLHCHIGSEALINLEHMKLFCKRYEQYLKDHSDPTTLLLRSYRDLNTGAITLDPTTSKPVYDHALDFSVYSNNRVFRLCGNRKPDGPLLRYVSFHLQLPNGSYTDDLPLTCHELLWRGMPNYALPSSLLQYDAMMMMDDTKVAAKKSIKTIIRGPRFNLSSHHELVYYILSPLLTSRMECDSYIHVDLNQRRLHGYCKSQTTPCHNLSTSGNVIHRSNRITFTLCCRQENMITAHVRCLSPRCSAFATQMIQVHSDEKVQEFVNKIFTQIV